MRALFSYNAEDGLKKTGLGCRVVCVCVWMVTTSCDGWEGEMFVCFPCVCVFTGEITTTAVLDREVKSEYILIVRAVDGGVGPLQKTGIATVTAHGRPRFPSSCSRCLFFCGDCKS